MINYGKVINVFLILQFSGTLQVAPKESQLLEKLLAGHSNDIRPLPKQLNGPTVVNITIKVVQVLDIDEKNEILSMLTWVTMVWEDSTFTWDPGAHENIKDLYFPAENIWLPDIMVFNTQQISSGFHLGLPESSEDAPFMAHAAANGSVALGFPHIFQSTCKLNISEYPFDTQYCPLTLGSWSHDSSELIINIDKEKLIREVQYSKTNKAWQITSSICKKEHGKCPFNDTRNNCNAVHCYLGLKRTAWFEVISYTLPTIVIAALSIMVFMVPPEAGKRMEVGITLILCVAVYLSLINKKMPSTSESFPLVSKFYGCIIVEITIAMVCSCFCLHIYDPEGLRLLHFPNYLRTLAFGVLARLTFYQTKGGKPSRIHPTNAEIKIVEKRRKSMVAINGTLQFSANTRNERIFAVRPTDNKQFRLPMEQIKECPENPEPPRRRSIPENINEINDLPNQVSSPNDETSEEQPIDMQLADIEEEHVENVLELNENQANGENRCDSGFGEPGGSLSIRSSLMSSNSVQLPVEASSPVPPTETNCECGQPGCTGQGDSSIHNETQESSAEEATANNDEAPMEAIATNITQIENQAYAESRKVEAYSIKRAKTTVFGDMSTEVNGPLVPKSISARPYTDSVLSTWKRARLGKSFRPSVRSKPSLGDFVLENSGPLLGKRKSASKENTTAEIPVEDSSTDKSHQGVEEQGSPRTNTTPKSDNSNVNRKENSSKENSEENSKENNSNLNATEEESPAPGCCGDNENAQNNEVSNSESKNASEEVTETSSELLNKRKSFDQIELVDINDDDNLVDLNVNQAKAVETTNKTLSEETEHDSSSPNTEQPIDNNAGLPDSYSSNSENKEVDRLHKNDSTDNESGDAESEVDENGDATPKTKKRSDSKMLFARRNWDTLRNRVQRRITVKEVFGQILSPTETSPIVAIANVLLRDQRKYVMRTEWMTSAMIFNRFFIILLALAVFISLLAVFMQSSRLRAFFDS